MASTTMNMFQNARFDLEQPIYGTSWGRCTHHNRNVGGKLSSAHLFTEMTLAQAGDVTLNKDHSPMTSTQYGQLLAALMENGFRRFGLDTHFRFIHADNGNMKPTPSIWFY